MLISALETALLVSMWSADARSTSLVESITSGDRQNFFINFLLYETHFLTRSHLTTRDCSNYSKNFTKLPSTGRTTTRSYLYHLREDPFYETCLHYAQFYSCLRTNPKFNTCSTFTTSNYYLSNYYVIGTFPTTSSRVNACSTSYKLRK